MYYVYILVWTSYFSYKVSYIITIIIGNYYVRMGGGCFNDSVASHHNFNMFSIFTAGNINVFGLKSVERDATSCSVFVREYRFGRSG